MKTLKYLTFCIFSIIFISDLAQAVQWKITGACSETPTHQGSTKTNFRESVGDFTLKVLTDNKIPYIGVAAGFNSINNSPIGLESIEVIDDESLRAYGWCYKINGMIPNEMPDKVHFLDQEDELEWFYAYSLNKKGQWMNYCIPAWTVKAPQFCPTKD